MNIECQNKQPLWHYNFDIRIETLLGNKWRHIQTVFADKHYSMNNHLISGDTSDSRIGTVVRGYYDVCCIWGIQYILWHSSWTLAMVDLQTLCEANGTSHVCNYVLCCYATIQVSYMVGPRGLWCCNLWSQYGVAQVLSKKQNIYSVANVLAGI